MMRSVWWRKCSTTPSTASQMKTRSFLRWGEQAPPLYHSCNICIYIHPHLSHSGVWTRPCHLLQAQKNVLGGHFSAVRRQLNCLHVNSPTHYVNTGSHTLLLLLLCLLFHNELHYENQQRWGNSWRWVASWDVSKVKANCASHFSTTVVKHFSPLPLRSWRQCTYKHIVPNSFLKFINECCKCVSYFCGCSSGGTCAAVAKERDRDPSWRPAANPQRDHRDPFLWRSAQGINAAYRAKHQ